MKNLTVLDCEVYPNYFLIAFKRVKSGKTFSIEVKGKVSCLSEGQRDILTDIMSSNHTFGFNSRNYDLPIILYALHQKTCEEIYNLSEYIINNNSHGWQTMKKYSLRHPLDYSHFDIQEPTPGVGAGLKLYGARIHSKKLQDLPIEPGTVLNYSEMENIKQYCINDLDTTIDLYNKIKQRISLREGMVENYSNIILSKSDAQIAEVVIKNELQNNYNTKIKKIKIPENQTFNYKIPDFIKFKNEKLKELLYKIENHSFELDGKGSIKLPDRLAKNTLSLGYSTYKIGIGGLHSQEKKQTIIPNKNQLLIDKDVASYYPSIILNLGLYPKHLGRNFLNVYDKIVQKRLKAKKENNKIVNESLKIVINGSFGKLGSKWSFLYSPDLMIAVTLTGQLSLLMLIEQLEMNNISIVSANTDGFVSLMNKSQYDKYQELCFDWELNTGFILEETSYKALYSRDVNNYLAIKSDSTKGKGIFTLDSLEKNPQGDISIIAVRDFLFNSTPIEDTIRQCTDVSRFLIVRRVTGGAEWKNEYLGKVVRWIYSTKGDVISYKKNGNKVAKSEGSRPIMEIPDELPSDINYQRYIEEAFNILDDIGYNNF